MFSLKFFVSGHASVLWQDGLFIHGGYQTFFPYPITTGAGAGRGTQTGTGHIYIRIYILCINVCINILGHGYTPFPTNPYYLDDLWLYNITTGRWQQIVGAPLDSRPGPRTEHSMVHTLLLHMLICSMSTGVSWFHHISNNRIR